MFFGLSFFLRKMGTDSVRRLDEIFLRHFRVLSNSIIKGICIFQVLVIAQLVSWNIEIMFGFNVRNKSEKLALRPQFLG